VPATDPVSRTVCLVTAIHPTGYEGHREHMFAKPISILVGVTLIPLAACGHSDKPGAAATPATTTAATSSTPSGQPVSTSSGPAPSTAVTSAEASGTGQCAESQLRASIDPRHVPGNGTPGKDGRQLHALIIDFQNISSSSCVMYGYPGATIVDSSGHQYLQASRALRGELTGLPVGQAAPTHVTLAPRAFAAASLEGTNRKNPGSAQAGCEPSGYPKILVTPPNTRTPVPFTVGWPMCYSFQVHPVQQLPDAP
jgi:hypothetical protein